MTRADAVVIEGWIRAVVDAECWDRVRMQMVDYILDHPTLDWRGCSLRDIRRRAESHAELRHTLTR